MLVHELWLRAVDIRLRLDWLAARLALLSAPRAAEPALPAPPPAAEGDGHLVAYV